MRQSHAGGDRRFVDYAGDTVPVIIDRLTGKIRRHRSLSRCWAPRTSPMPAEEMTCWPVSTRVGNVKDNDPSLIDPVALAG